MPKRPCACGREREEVAADLVRRFVCAACGSEETLREPRSGPLVGDAAPDAATRRRAPGRAAANTETADVGVSLATPPPASRPWSLDLAASGADPATIVEARAATPGSTSATASARFLPPPGFLDRSPELAAGARLGDFAIVDVLGSGGMGIVYRARDEALERDVALKVVSPALCRSAAFVERFRREARAAAALSHPNITTIYAIGESAGTHFYAMELVRGRNLVEVLDARGALPPAEAVRIAREAAEGLREAAARRIIHRDVKPSNLLLSESGRVKITDFGLAKALLGSVDHTTTGVVMGTPVYMSPEQGTGKEVDLRSDVYSLGVTLYQLVFGKPPFVADSALSLMVKHLQEEPEFPDGASGPRPAALVAVLRKMLAKDPARRYATYDALVADLGAFLEGRPVAAMREAPPSSDGPIVLRRAARGATASQRTAATAEASAATHSRSRISLARSNLKMGRADRAQALLKDVVREDAEHRVEAALLLVEIADAQKDEKAAREALEVVAREAKDPAEAAYAALRIAAADEREAIARERAALAAYERVAKQASPAVEAALAAKTKAMRARIEQAEKALERVKVVLAEGEGG